MWLQIKGNESTRPRLGCLHASSRNDMASERECCKKYRLTVSNEAFARKEEQKEMGQLEHNKPRRLHHL